MILILVVTVYLIFGLFWADYKDSPDPNLALLNLFFWPISMLKHYL